MSEKAYIGDGKKVHLVVKEELGLYAYVACGIGGRFYPTSRPVDCKVCLRHMAKAAGEKR